MDPMTPDIPADQLVAANEDAADFFRRQLLGLAGPRPRRYLTERGFGVLLDDTKWAIGYAPGPWNRLGDHLAALGYSQAVLAAAGLTSNGTKGQVFDTFRDRITFAVRDPAGRVIGFVGRAGPNAGPATPRYLNTRKTPIYDKSVALFGLAERSSETPQTLVIAEGPLDAIAIDVSTGATTVALATCGTAFTPNHARAVADLRPHAITIALDPDTAGSQGLLRTYEQLKDTNQLGAVRLPSGTDPADLFREQGARALAEAIRSTRPAADEVVDHHLRTWRTEQTGAEAELCLLREVLRDVRRMPKPDIARQVGRLAALLPFDHTTITRELVADIPVGGSVRSSLRGPARGISRG
ncbi:MAG: dnaG [Marmoricola sp.]|nr:dnaG [Marmoricola sp.]